MVLQRDIDIPVWGKANPGTTITVEIANHQVKTVAGQDGNWMLHLPRMKAGGPYTMTVYLSDRSQPDILLENILIGEVWLASGQSNMEWQVQQSKDAHIEIHHANYPQIRFFNVPHNKKIIPQTDLSGGSWEICDTSNVKAISAVAYYYSRKLYKDLNIPIGIIQSTWGGTPVEAWTSREQLLSSPVTRQRVIDDDSITVKDFIKDSLDLIRFWKIVYNPLNGTDSVIPKKSYDDSKWPVIDMPKTLKDWGMPFYEGMVWLRKTVTIPENMCGKDLTIHLGHPEMNYSLYVNGKVICKTIWNANLTHSYTIPADIIKKGQNIIAVRMAFLWGGGGFNPPADEMYLSDGTAKISLTGSWKYMKDLETGIPKIYNYHRYPAYLFNGMISPLIPYGIRGFIWYQGEDNVDEAGDYIALFSLLITDWRIRWQLGYLPFLYVQLANYMKTQPEPSESEWAELREAQTKTLSKPNTGMACIIDIGDANSIHPLNKQEVGRRLGLLAEKMIYNISVQAYGPMYKNYKIDGNKVIIEFSETGEGLTVRDNNNLKGFAVAGKNQKFYWADAAIKDNTVIVSSPKVSKPIAVRYAWADNPECNLINKNGLPAIPFRIDNWEKIEGE